MKCDFCGHHGHDESTKACPVRVASVAKFTNQPNTMTAQDILREALATIEARGKTYDPAAPDGERSMPRIVELFEEQTGVKLTEAQGWRFMQCVKEARLESSPGHRDSVVDKLAYAALELEAVTREQQATAPAKKQFDLATILERKAPDTQKA